ncbi:Hypothetical protein, putative [Bodo saltans]|uniref:Uncharacterized protein n=1 Tax=Bodo saltans TaxID=75058 RepID=A0A0S4J2L8_BODSA|nr:Hypothetical protein, putative [Bodo saltans]|eukprot:CUG69565.1 Hypothetical protein, putative [Bodo saltans]
MVLSSLLYGSHSQSIAATIFYVMWRGRVHRQFLLLGVKRRTPTTPRRGSRFAVGCGSALRHVVHLTADPSEEWAPRPPHRGTKEYAIARMLLEHLSPVFEMYVDGREWYFLVEWGVCIVSAAVLGAAQAVATSSSSDACNAAQWCSHCLDCNSSRGVSVASPTKFG